MKPKENNDKSVTLSDTEYSNILWYTDYFGIGYALDKKGWSVFPIFSNPLNAKMIWKDQIESLEENTLKMRFIEYENKYKFILYPFPFQKNKVNFGFYRSINSLKTYKIFKRNFPNKAFFTFGAIGDGSKPDVLNRAKLVSDIQFFKSTDVKENSIEWMAEKAQRANED